MRFSLNLNRTITIILVFILIILIIRLLIIQKIQAIPIFIHFFAENSHSNDYISIHRINMYSARQHPTSSSSLMSAVATFTVQDDTDMCPICKSSRYLNPDMRFLVNSECYHKMCESCVERIFAMGPAPCPYPGCDKILRKNRFKTQVFEDIGVEKEVDVRTRVQRTFNKQQRDFPSLEEYNDYLEEIEDIVFNLSNGIDVEETEKKLHAYEQANRSAILANNLRNRQEDEAFEESKAFELENKKRQIALIRQIEIEEQTIKKEGEQELLRRLAVSDGGDADAITQTINDTVAERIAAKRKELENQLSTVPKQFMRRSASQHAPNSPNVPFTPFNGDRQTNYLFTAETSYDDPWLSDIDKNVQYKAGGVLLQDAYKQALIQAFFGLGCDIQEERKHVEEEKVVDVIS